MGQADESGHYMPVLFVPNLEDCIFECESFFEKLEMHICAYKENNPKIDEYKQALSNIRDCVKTIKTILPEIHKY